MKPFMFAFIFLLWGRLATLMSGQPQLTNNVFPVVGDTVVYLQGISTGVYEGDSGPNAVWDFSALQPQPNSTETIRIYLNPVGTPYEGQFLNSNLCYQDIPNSSTYQYLKKESNKISRLGSANNTSTRKFSNTEDFLKTPLSYLNQFSDNYVSTITYSFAPPVYQHGSFTTEYDAYGVLNLPQGAFNAIRTRTDDNRVDSTIQYPPLNYCEVDYISITRYSWYIPNVEDPALTVSYVSGITKKYDACMGAPTITQITPSKSVRYRGDHLGSTLDTDEIIQMNELAVTSAYLNNGRLILSINTIEEQDCLLRVLTVDGKLVLEDRLNLVEGENPHDFNLLPLPNGPVILSLSGRRSNLGKLIMNNN